MTGEYDPSPRTPSQSDSHYSGILHYLDNFLSSGPPGSQNCMHLLNKSMSMCQYFGIPIALEKMVLPTHSLDFLGITLDSSKMECRLPEKKILKLRNALSGFLFKKKITLKKLQSLLGLLNFALLIIPICRAFSRRLHDATKGLLSPGSHIRVCLDLKEDVKIWLDFLSTFNSRSCWQSLFILADFLPFIFSTHTSIGYGILFSSYWSVHHWPESWVADH
ncbi:unnamed protein product, partial [Ranitomeya imitator]